MVGELAEGVAVEALVVLVVAWVQVTEQGPEAEVAAASARLPHCLTELERPLTAAPYLAGDAMTVADLYLLPMIHYLALTPEGAAVLPGFPRLLAWQERMNARASVKATLPPSFDSLRSAA